MSKKQGGKFWFTNFLITLIISFGLFACVSKNIKNKDIIDPEANLSRQDYEDLIPPVIAHSEKETKSRKNQTSDSKAPAIPDATEILTTPKPPELTQDKLVSISVTEDVPLKDVLIELGRLADIDMEIDPGISGGIIMKATNRPFSEVLQNVVSLGGLRMSKNNGSIKIERDFPYQVNYVTDFLNIVRSSTGSVNVSTNVIGSSSGGDSGDSGGGGVSSGSTNEISSSYEGDLWKSVEASLQNIIGSSSGNTTTSSSSDGSASSSTGSSSATMDINKQAGVISVFATQKQHHDIERYLSTVKDSVSSQVLIEAKIVEVTLSKEFSSGIDWGTLSDSNLGLKFSGNFGSLDSTAAGVLTLAASTNTAATGSTLKSAVNLLSKFGTSRTLSSPRLHAMNNQQAVLTFAENNVYFTLEVQEKTDAAATGTTGASTLTVQSSLKTVPIGVILSLQPSINLKTNEVTMNIRPTLSRITGKISDPGVDIIVARQKSLASDPTQFANVKSEIPIIEVRELDSILKVKSGEIMVIGGLMKDEATNIDTGVPGLSTIPFIGNAFKGVSKSNKTVETVIFIKATIIPSDGIVPKADKDVYKKYMRDPRPLAF